MKNILINFAHPARARSLINNALRDAIENIENVTVNDLYANYPDFHIDVKKEQRLCEEHEIIVFQHPFYWYSTPSIIKEWLDLVLEHGWAYGNKGNALKGKLILQALTAGGDDSAYNKDGFISFTIDELTSPFRATAKLCKMNWLPPFTVLGVNSGIKCEELKKYADEYRQTILALRDERLDIYKAQEKKYINSDLNSIIRKK